MLASIQTLTSEILGHRRYNKFDPNDYSLLLVDEAHHAISNSYRTFIDYMKQNKSLRVVGVTATPDRSDEMAMGTVFDTCCYQYSILDGINQGWLVHQAEASVFGHLTTRRSRQWLATCAPVNWQRCWRKKNLHGMIHPTLELAGDRPTIIFTATVRQAELQESSTGIGGECSMGIRQDAKDAAQRIVGAAAAGKLQWMSMWES